MRIGIEINGVLRDTLGKLEEVYNKNTNEKTEEVNENEEHIELLELTGIFSEMVAQDKNINIYKFLYEEYSMEIFGYARSSEMLTFNYLNEFYIDFRNNHDIIIVSNEYGKSKPASLFFLSKFRCEIETIKFYSEYTKDSMWDSVDLLVTANPFNIKSAPNNKIIVKYETEYNKHVLCDKTISSINDLKNIILEYA